MRVPQRSRWLLGATGLYAVAFLFWLGLEDLNLNWVVALGGGGSGLLVAHAVVARWPGAQLAGARAVLVLGVGGLVVGGLAAAVTLVLMALKTGLHAHDVPDFTVAQLQGILRAAPAWSAAGALAGVALSLLATAYAARTRITRQ